MRRPFLPYRLAVIACAIAIGALACGGQRAPEPVVPATTPATTATAAAADDAIVARVNGRPVWRSCVEAQARHGDSDLPAPALDPRAALDECVAFELLAQAAEQRGFARDREVWLAYRDALVNRLVELAYERGMTKPEDFGAAWRILGDKISLHLDHPEVRASSYIRVPVDAKATPEADAAARAVAERVAAATAAEPGLLPAHLNAIAERVAAGATIQHADVPPNVREGFVKPYADALFAIPEIGRTSPAVRTKWGWDVVLFTDVIAEVHPAPATLTAQMLPEIKRNYFGAWVERLAAEHAVQIQRFAANIDKLEDLP